MPLVAHEVDIEHGIIRPQSQVIWDGNDEQSVVSMSNYVAGVLLFLFLAGLLPLSLLVLASVLLVCLATCIRAYVVHQFEQNLTNGQGMNTFAEAFHIVSGGQPMLIPSPQINLQNLRLSLMRRDFGASDYDALLALDLSGPTAPSQAASEDLIASLPTFKHSRNCKHGAKRGEEHLCSVCLDPFAEGAAVTQLPCHHSFHGDCIQPWLRQQGMSATCPLCKANVWQKQ